MSHSQYNLLMLLESSDENETFHYSHEWYSSIESLSEQQFSETFRMSRNCFEKLIKRIKKKVYSKIQQNPYISSFFLLRM